MFRSSAVQEATAYSREGQLEGAASSVMSVQGTMAKTALLLLVATVAAAFTWKQTIENSGAAMPWAMGGMIGGLVLAVVLGFKPKLAPILAVPYAGLEGLFLGAISAVYALNAGELAIGGMALGSNIVLQAVLVTFGVSFAMLGLYAFRLINVTNKMRSIVMAATGGIFFVYMISFALSFFGVSVPLIHSAGPLGILFSLFVVGLAAFNLLLDFDWIERGARSGGPRWMEWFGAFALLVTLVWLYIEVLRLLSKLQSRDD